MHRPQASAYSIWQTNTHVHIKKSFQKQHKVHSSSKKCVHDVYIIRVGLCVKLEDSSSEMLLWREELYILPLYQKLQQILQAHQYIGHRRHNHHKV